MNWNSFNDAKSLENKLLFQIGTSLRISIKENNEALVLLSRGLNSISLYRRFSEIKKIDWSKVKFGMVDDRWISDNTNHSNFQNISNALGKEIVEKSLLVPLVFPSDIEQNNISREKLMEMTGGMTVPQIIIDDKPIGGFDQLFQLHQSGKLEEILKNEND